MSGRIVLLVTSPRLPAGLLTAEAWDLARAYPVLTAVETEQVVALRAASVDVSVTERGADDLLTAVATSGTVVWLAGPTGDQPLARDLGLRLARDPGLAEMELMYGSWDPPGARLLDAVTVMDRLASPGGDPWKRQQTHRSLAKYMIEEVYEAYDAIGADDYAALREELGDVLLQVVLHARMAEELPDGRAWTIDDVAGDLVAKLIRRNPHVFADASAATIDEITAQWEQIKAEEKAGRGPMDGIAMAQPALSLATKIQERGVRAGLRDVDPGRGPDTGAVSAGAPARDPGIDIGERLWALVAEATSAGLDAEGELRRTALARLAAYRDAATG